MAKHLFIRNEAIISLDRESRRGLALLIKFRCAPFEKTRYFSWVWRRWWESPRGNGIKFARSAAFGGCSERARRFRWTTQQGLEFGQGRNVGPYSCSHNSGNFSTLECHLMSENVKSVMESRVGDRLDSNEHRFTNIIETILSTN